MVTQKMTNPSFNEIVIERASSEDADEILNLQKEGFLFEAELYDDYTIPPLHQTIDSILKEIKDAVVLKAVVAGKIVGTVRAHHEHNTCFIAKLVVRPAYQNLGLAQLLMKSIQAEFQQVDRFELFTGFKSEKNLYLYKKLGYIEFKRQTIRPNVTLVFLEKLNKNQVEGP
jgi:N-acetylglutamate synthase-like GNAT family acetyltransferase